MTALLTGLVSLLVFGSVILVHELGHFLAARHCGIHVEEFSIGFGPQIFQRRRGSTTYTLTPVPLGGYNLFSPCRRTTRTRTQRKLPRLRRSPPPSSHAACFRSALFPVVGPAPLRKPPPGGVLS